MSWESVDTYQQLVELNPDLSNQTHRDAFHTFLDRMWTKPSTLTEFTKAYMEFTIPDKLTFPKLNAMAQAKAKKTKSRRSRRSRRGRSRRHRKSTRS